MADLRRPVARLRRAEVRLAGRWWPGAAPRCALQRRCQHRCVGGRERRRGGRRGRTGPPSAPRTVAL